MMKLNFQLTLSEGLGVQDLPALVLIHGMESDLHTWDAVMPYFSAVDVLRVDLRGHGKSDLGALELLSYQQLVSDVIICVEEVLPARRLVIVGHSMGARIAVGCSAILGDRVEHVILVDQCFEPRVARSLPDRQNRSVFVGEFPLRVSVDSLATLAELFEPFSYGRERIEKWLQKGRIVKDGYTYLLFINPLTASLVHNAVQATSCALEDFKMLARLQTPVVALFAESPRTGSVTPEGLARLHQLHSGFTSHAIVDSGHSIHKDQTQKFVSVVEFLIGLRAELE